MKTIRAIYIIASFVAFSLVFSASPVFTAPKAQADDTSSSTIATVTSSCMVTAADLDAITAAQSQDLTAELTVRKAILQRVVNCAKTDAQGLQASLSKVTVSDDAQSFKGQLNDHLNDAVNYYDIELAKINDAGIFGTKSIAKEILSWRKANYDPLSGQVANFTLWAQNQNLFILGQNRLTQIKTVVSFLIQAAPNNDLQNALANATTLFKTASDENAAAKTALLQSLPADQSLAHIKASLQALADAYKKFSDISAAIQKLLPATSK